MLENININASPHIENDINKGNLLCKVPIFNTLSERAFIFFPSCIDFNPDRSPIFIGPEYSSFSFINPIVFFDISYVYQIPYVTNVFCRIR